MDRKSGQVTNLQHLRRPTFVRMRGSSSARGSRHALQCSRRSSHVPAQHHQRRFRRLGRGHAKAKAFARVDTNADASLDKAELQAAFDAVAAKTGKTARDAEAVIARIDRNGDGAVTRLEIRAHARDLRAAPPRRSSWPAAKATAPAR